MIRITGGKNRSRLLTTPSTDKTKPTMDKVRAAVFNALQSKIVNSDVLDLFAGSGSYGFESESRGANFITFVDKTIESKNAIKENASSLGVENYEYIHSDAIAFLKDTNKQYDIIFADPPYALKVYDDIVRIVLERNLIKESGVLILETEHELNIEKSQFIDIRFYKYGLAKIYLLRK